MRRDARNNSTISLLVPWSRTRAGNESFVVNGTFDNVLADWKIDGHVQPVDGKARFAPQGALSQIVTLPERTRQVQLEFDISDAYGAAAVRLSNGPSLRIPGAGHYAPIVDVPDGLTSVELHFSTSPAAFDLDNVSMRLLFNDCAPGNLVKNPDFDSNMSDWITANVTSVDGKARSGPNGVLSQNLGYVQPGSTGTIEFEISADYGGSGSVMLDGIVSSSFKGGGIHQGSFTIPDDYEKEVILRFFLPACDIDDIRVMGCRVEGPARSRSSARSRYQCGCCN